MKIKSVKKKSPAGSAGLLPGDEIVEINGGPARDEIDLLYYGSEEQLCFTVARGNRTFTVEFDGGVDHGIEFEPMECMSCGNNCIFCFVDQNPAGMRKPLYFKDEDYRFSFLHGAYVTLTAMKEPHLRRIVKQHLSPLYISVHVTESAIRKKMLGISREDNLMEKIDRLVESGITLHCQILVCPGINDGSTLQRTVGDLRERFPGIQSAAIVPVGLTKHREGLFPLMAVDRDCAAKIIDTTGLFHEECISKTGKGFVYCADELFIRADSETPGKEYYDDFPQIENGVGMLRNFLDNTSNIEDRLDDSCVRHEKYVLVTGISMSDYIADFARRLSSTGSIEARVVTVSNGFYGDSVTVSGLLTGGDIINALDGTAGDEIVVLPPNCLNEDGIFLDDLSPEDIAGKFGVEVIQGTYDPLGFLHRRI